MAKTSAPPETASVAHAGVHGRLHAPSAERNAHAITEMLCKHVVPQGAALELASGTGQHVAAFARALPGLVWQPSEIEADRRQSIDAWAETAGDNLLPAIALDATEPGWAQTQPGQDVIIVINLLHLISAPRARTLITEAALALAPGGRFFIYGPFLREGRATSAGDAQFDASLRAHDALIGYKDLGDVRQWLADAGLQPVATVDMPANNLTLVSEQKPESP